MQLAVALLHIPFLARWLCVQFFFSLLCKNHINIERVTNESRQWRQSCVCLSGHSSDCCKCAPTAHMLKNQNVVIYAVCASTFYWHKKAKRRRCSGTRENVCSSRGATSSHKQHLSALHLLNSGEHLTHLACTAYIEKYTKERSAFSFSASVNSFLPHTGSS